MDRHPGADRDWVGLSEASRLLGVSPVTLRRWSNAGRVRVFTTPGGHRRFSRAALLRRLPADRSRRPSVGKAGLTPGRLARTYRRAMSEAVPGLAWVHALTDDQRAPFRQRGHRIAAGLLRYLDASEPETAARHLTDASIAAVEYGRIAAELGLSVVQTVEAFLAFRSPFRHELAAAARPRGFDAAETAELLESAEQAMDHLLVAVLTGAPGSVPQRASRPRTGPRAWPKSNRDTSR